jgi:hypothetical protein
MRAVRDNPAPCPTVETGHKDGGRKRRGSLDARSLAQPCYRPPKYHRPLEGEGKKREGRGGVPLCSQNAHDGAYHLQLILHTATRRGSERKETNRRVLSRTWVTVRPRTPPGVGTPLRADDHPSSRHPRVTTCQNEMRNRKGKNEQTAGPFHCSRNARPQKPLVGHAQFGQSLQPAL